MSKFDKIFEEKFRLYKEGFINTKQPIQNQQTQQNQNTTQTQNQQTQQNQNTTQTQNQKPQQNQNTTPTQQPTQQNINYKDPNVLNNILTGLSDAAKDPSIAKIIADFQSKQNQQNQPKV